MNDPWLYNWNLENKIKEKSYKNIPQANMLDLIMNLFSFVLLTYILTKFRYKFHPSTVIQKNVVSKKYCISAAINWQPMRGVTLSIPAKNTISSATKEEQRHRRILDDSFLRRLLKREIISTNLIVIIQGIITKGIQIILRQRLCLYSFNAI